MKKWIVLSVFFHIFKENQSEEPGDFVRNFQNKIKANKIKYSKRISCSSLNLIDVQKEVKKKIYVKKKGNLLLEKRELL